MFEMFTDNNQAADIVRVVLDHGKLRPPDILASLSVYDTKSMPCTQGVQNVTSNLHLI